MRLVLTTRSSFLCLILVIAITLLAWVSVGLLSPPPVIDTGHTKRAQVQDSGVVEAGASERYLALKGRYALLESERQALKRRLARLRHALSGLRFLAGQAKLIERSLASGFRLLEMPKMLGAFSSIEAIDDELARIRFVNSQLDEVQVLIQQSEAE